MISLVQNPKRQYPITHVDWGMVIWTMEEQCFVVLPKFYLLSILLVVFCLFLARWLAQRATIARGRQWVFKLYCCALSISLTTMFHILDRLEMQLYYIIIFLLAWMSRPRVKPSIFYFENAVETEPFWFKTQLQDIEAEFSLD